MSVKNLIFSLIACALFIPLSAQYYDDSGCYNNFCDPCNGWFLQGELLYWKIRRSELDYSIDSYDTTNTPLERRPNGDIHCVEPCYDTGVRVRISKECADFYTALTWTNFNHTSSHRTLSENGNPVILPTRLHPAVAGFDTADEAEGIYNFCLNQFDLDFGVSCEVNECQKILPYIGFRYTRLDQKLDAIALNSGSGYSTDNFQRMDAYALTCGTKGVAKYCDCFELFVNAGGALHLADFDSHRDLFTMTDNVKFDNESLLYARKKECLWVVSIDLALGMGFDVCKTACGEFSLFLGYEFHKWFCLPDFLNFTDDFRTGCLARNQANLGYDGLFAGVRASF